MAAGEEAQPGRMAWPSDGVVMALPQCVRENRVPEVLESISFQAHQILRTSLVPTQ